MCPGKLRLSEGDFAVADFWNVVLFGSEEAGRIVVEATLRELNGSVETERAGAMRKIFFLSVGVIDT